MCGRALSCCAIVGLVDYPIRHAGLLNGFNLSIYSAKIQYSVFQVLSDIHVFGKLKFCTEHCVLSFLDIGEA